MIVIMGDCDWAGIGYSLYQALISEGIEAHHIVGYPHLFKYKYEILSNFRNDDLIRSIIHSADYILYMSSCINFAPRGIRNSSVRKGVWHVGTGYRVRPDFFNQLEGVDQFAGPGMVECCSKFHPLNAPIDTDKYSYIDKDWNGPIIIGHSPSNDRTKSTGEFMVATKEMSTDIICDVSYSECMERKKSHHIFFDQMDGYDMAPGESRAYGVSSVESAALGSIVLNASDIGPFINVHSIEDMRQTIEYMNDHRDELENISREHRYYIEENHSYKKVVEQLMEVVNE